MYAEWNDAFLILYRAICLGFSFFFFTTAPFLVSVDCDGNGFPHLRYSYEFMGTAESIPSQNGEGGVGGGAASLWS